MARGKFNKRGGGKRVDAQSAQEIEQRNQRLAEFEELRAKRRAEAEEEENGGGGGDDDAEEDEEKAETPKSSKPKEAPVQVTSAEDHKRNLAKLEAVRKRREEAEKRRKAEQEAEEAQEVERKMKAASLQADSDDEDDKKGKKKKKKEVNIPKLTKIEIKKMKPTQMKEALKLRGLDIQGNAKVLTKRLVDYEEAR